MSPKSNFPCPACGEDVPAKAKACPHCGADEKSGWNEEESSQDGLDLPGGDFDYEKFKAEEFGEASRFRGKKLFWWWATVVLLVIFAVLTLFNHLWR